MKIISHENLFPTSFINALFNFPFSEGLVTGFDTPLNFSTLTYNITFIHTLISPGGYPNNLATIGLDLSSFNDALLVFLDI
jgi:hypothetical protein